ncbi:MAG: L-threonylcarbamoyladenylate synthase [Cyanobacteriota bacterium]|nr:L-threonylcarbamoyladenylate synthase [Cyanobacteriota bacterium]
MTQVTQTELIAGAVAGKVVSFPTDTVPALAVRPDRAALIFALKQRSRSQPLILMGSSWSQLRPFVSGSEREFELWGEVAQKFWPGALTLVLPASLNVPPQINPLEPTTIGVRVPNLQLPREILTATGPLATTSANLSGEPPLETIAEIDAVFSEVLTLVPTQSDPQLKWGNGLPSTVVKWKGTRWEILRRGPIADILDYKL